MKKIKFLFFAVAFAVAQICSAVIAYPGWIDFKQPDGTIVKIRLHGSEFVKWAESEDGYTLLYDSHGNLVFADIDSNGDLKPTDMLAVNINERNVNVRMRLQTIDKKLAFSSRQVNMLNQAAEARRRTIASLSDSKKPIVGTRKMLLILVDFQDYKFQKTKQDFEMLMNQLDYTGDGRYGSVRDFYRENSFGKLDLTTDVAGVYHLANVRAYYGGNDDYGSDANPREMALEAVTMADADVNYADYDNDGDGTVDGVHIIYAGPGEEAGGGNDCIWAHSWSISARLDGKRINKYSCSPEIRGSRGSNITHIGVICHELGHVLGCMDFYDTDYNMGGQYQGTGNWDVMGAGSWNGDGACPAHFNPYVKIYDFGWAEAADGNTPVAGKLYAKSPDGFMRIDTQTEGEYFLLEYRHKSGFDSCIPGHGLMVYRASENLNRSSSNKINAWHKQQFYPLCANSQFALPESEPGTYGTLNSPSAPFPGTDRIMELTDFTTPSLLSWDKSSTDKPITEIEENVSEKYVTFNVAGGVNAGAYAFNVSETTTSSISLSWSMKTDVPVMLVYSMDAVFGEPENRNYNAGENLDGGGIVLFCGHGTSFIHEHLEESTMYYYKLFSFDKEKNTWTTVRIRNAKTEVGIIRRFPFVEDFESKNLDDSWKQEHIVANTDWTVDELFETDDNMLIFSIEENAYENEKQRTRIIMPQIDFAGKKCAAISFDCRNFLQIFEVAYRTSPDEKWNVLTEIESSYGHVMQGLDDIINDVSRVSLVLPRLSTTYEISFVADYVMRNNGWSNSEVATIDNLEIRADYDIFVVTRKPDFVGSHIAKIDCEAHDGLDVVSERGIQWSTDNNNWTKVRCGSDGKALLEGLPAGSSIYYRGYGITASGSEIYGNVLTFRTLLFENGTGTAEDPFIISSGRDIAMIQEAVLAGNDCSGLSFVFGNSFSIMSAGKTDAEFNGHIDGKGYTLTFRDGSSEALFENLGAEAVVCNLNIAANAFALKNHRSSTLCIYNYGTISNCNVTLNGFDTNSTNRNFGGLCSDNMGYIISCSADISAKAEQLWCGGMCWYNYNIIVDCTFKGHLSSNNNYNLGGIAVLNYEYSKNGKNLYGKIYNCTNNGKIEAYELDGNSHNGSLGGICGGNYGIIDGCVNYGNLIVLEHGGSDGGGICGTMSRYASIRNSYNKGQVIVRKVANNNNDLSGVGGIAGFASGTRLSIENCYSSVGVVAEIENVANVHEILGRAKSDIAVRNCFYTGGYADSRASKCTYDELCSQEYVDKLNRNGKDSVWVISDGTPVLSHELTGVTMFFDDMFDADYDEVVVPWIVSGDGIAECGIEWREQGTSDWNVVEGVPYFAVWSVISDLPAAYPLDVRMYAVKSDGKTLFSGTAKLATDFATTGTEIDPHVIPDYRTMLAFSSMVRNGKNFLKEIVRLDSDLDLKGEKGVLWEPIKSLYNNDMFLGEFDGNGHELSHMYIETDEGYAGLFAKSNGYIHDLMVSDSKIVSKAIPNECLGYVGVGGIVGAGTTGDGYSCVVERCGYTGTITGGNPIGGIMGTGCDGAVKDCYVLASLNHTYSSHESVKYNNDNKIAVGAFAGGIIGLGSADGCYFKGDISMSFDTYFAFNGPVSAKYSDDLTNKNCYYNATSSSMAGFDNYKEDSELDVPTMRSDKFLDHLSSGVWRRADWVNDGFPVPASCGNSNVTTFEAYHNAVGDVVLSGIYKKGVDKNYDVCGFQWYSTNKEEISVNEIVGTNNSTPYECVLPNRTVGKDNLIYRAFVAVGTDSLFGEWKTFVPQILVPQAYIMNVEPDGNIATVNYSIDCGTEVVDKCVLTYYPQNVEASAIEKNIDADALQFVIEGLEKDVRYECFITVTTVSGNDYESGRYIWIQGNQSDVYKITYMIDGNVFAVVPLRSGEKIVPIEVPEIEGYEFSGWDIPYEYMPEKDIVVYGTYISTDIEMPSEDERLVDVYAVDGRRVMSRTTMSEARKTLPKGIYIIERRKVLIR